MRRGLGTMAVLALFACALPVRAAGAPRLVVMLQSFTGAPADSASRMALMNAFQDEFDADEVPWQKKTGETWGSSGDAHNRYHLVDLAAPEAAWGLDVTIGLPPPVLVAPHRQRAGDPTSRPRATDYRAARGLTIVVTTTPPQQGEEREPGEPIKFGVYFPDAKRVVVPSPNLPGGAYAYPWKDAGRVVARAALEALRRANDALADDERADLSPAVRTEDTP